MKIAVEPRQEGEDLESALRFTAGRGREHILVGMDELRIDADTGELVHGDTRYTMTEFAAVRLATRLGINPKYVLKIPNDLAAINYNTFLETAIGHTQLVIQTDDDGENVVTGFLREKTIPIEPEIVFSAVADEVERTNIQLYRWVSNASGIMLRMGNQDLVVEPRVGDVVFAGADIVIHENQDMAISTRGSVLRLICLNGATTQVSGMLSRTARRESGQEPSSRVIAAVGSASDMAQIAWSIAQNLSAMTRFDLNLPTTFDERTGYLSAGVRAIPERPIRNRAMIESVAEAIHIEEPTVYGLYNALTRIGRDAVSERRRDIFERAGLQLAINPNPTAAAFADFVIDEDDEE